MDMTKQNRAELQQLRRAEKKIKTDATRAARDRDKAMRIIDGMHATAKRKHCAENKRAEVAVDRAIGKILRRVGILEGRLA